MNVGSVTDDHWVPACPAAGVGKSSAELGISVCSLAFGGNCSDSRVNQCSVSFANGCTGLVGQ